VDVILSLKETDEGGTAKVRAGNVSGVTCSGAFEEVVGTIGGVNVI
jgi:hypothetical protein